MITMLKNTMTLTTTLIMMNMKKVVGDMLGHVTYRNRCHALAPSMDAASCRSRETS